jgi:uncharacterized protein YndB with AHSA1/START domain
MTNPSDTRTIEVELPIDAPREAVWKALTDAGELKRWFPFDARTEPGEGGMIALSWGAEMQGAMRIRTWKPNERLTTTWMEPTELFGAPPPRPKDAAPSPFETDREAAARLVVDFHLEGRRGVTVLRLAHSGFSRDARWDEEFTAHRRGWNFELRSLRNYLEHHRDRTRQVVWVRQPVSIALDDAWRKLMGPSGVLREGSLEGIRAGDRYGFTTVHGDRFEGEAFNVEPPFEFSGDVQNQGLAMLRCGVETWTGRPEAIFWVSTWDDPSRAAQYRQRWTGTLRSLFAA